ncbi:MAG: HAD family phosphatase [Lactobacillaceae bacterium]|jgi:HAD superfamily hydrolase (TIGR01509 family)|nr:HAD family phosphatase [Lactobacillaceae bacterium]
MKKLIIWDFDGVIADTEKLWVSVWREYMNKKFNLGWDEKKAHEVFAGVSVKTKLERLSKLGLFPSEEDLENILSGEIVKMNKEMIITKDIVDIFKNAKVKQCIATGGILSKTMKKIKILGLEEYFNESNVFCADMVEHGKPEPDLFLFAAQKMGFEPKDCVIIEDSYAGITAAQRAGIDVIGFAEHQNLDKERFVKDIKEMGVRNIALNMQEVKTILLNM